MSSDPAAARRIVVTGMGVVSPLGLTLDEFWNACAGRKSAVRPYTVEGKFVELVWNGKHMGNYYLCEHVQIAKARLAIDELKEENTELPEIQGGYLLMFSPDESEGPDAFETSHRLLLGTKDPSFDPENGGYVNDAQKPATTRITWI